MIHASSQPLSTRIFLAFGLILVLTCAASVGVTYRAQEQLAEQEMNAVLDNELLALSALVSARPADQFDFEITPFFLSRYREARPGNFFRFIAQSDHRVLRENPGSPNLECGVPVSSLGGVATVLGNKFRYKSSVFRPEIDSEVKNGPVFEPGQVCLVVGLEEAPYRALAWNSIVSTVPVMIILAFLMGAVLLFFVRRITGDLSRLTRALEFADFGATHAFPVLPHATTLEVSSVIDKLASLHVQASDVYKDMWLFFGRAAHQLKTPVAAMQATLQVLLRRERTKEELMIGLVDVESAAGSLANLTQKLLTLSRLSYQEGVDEKRQVSLDVFFEDLFKRFSALAQKHQVLLKMEMAGRSSVPTRVPTVAGSIDILSDLFGNLIENAILYSPGDRETVVCISWKVFNNQIEVLVEDQSNGLPKQVTKTLFEPFVRGDERKVLGSGLGLSIAKKSAQLLSGEIKLVETGKMGSIFSVTLPLGS